MEISNEDQLLALKFGTRDELLTGVRNFYSKRGYALSIFRSEPDKHVNLRCDRSGRYRNSHKISEEERKKQTNSRLINCMFQLHGKKQDDGMWTIEIKKNEHNHGPSVDIAGHPTFRRLTDDERRDVDHMSNSGIPPRQILSSIRQNNPETRIISKTISLQPSIVKSRRRTLKAQTIPTSINRYQSDVLFEPTIPSRENRFQAAKKRKAKSSTRRDPSQFEIVEARWQCSSSNGVPQSNRMHQVATDFEDPCHGEVFPLQQSVEIDALFRLLSDCKTLD